MIENRHNIDLYVNGQLLELESQESINLRFNNTIYDPEKIASTQAEYSFSFEIPSTPINDKIFDYANNLSKLNKFHQRWNAEVYADGINIFTGSLTLNGFKDKKYQCNLVSFKVFSLDEIFGEDVMTDIKLPSGEHWDIPFDGAGDGGYTINFYNGLMRDSGRTDVCFPMLCYGAFQKSPISASTRDELKEYTSKFEIDHYNRWYVESFYPHLGVLETLKRAFEYKGYNVNGNVFQDEFLKNVYMTVNLASEQTPTYNLGNPKFGSVGLSTTYDTSGKIPYEQELKYPYYKVFGHVDNGFGAESTTEYNLSSVFLYDLLSSGSVVVNSATYMYQPNEHIIVIPESGFYKIEMRVDSRLGETGTLNVGQWIYDRDSRTMERQTVALPVGFNENTPIEVALVRNYDDSYELIKGKHNRNYNNGNPTQETYTVNNQTYPNVNEWLTCYPHEDPYNSELASMENEIISNNSGERRDDGAVHGNVGQRRASSVTRNGESGQQAYNGGSGGRTVDGSGFNGDSQRRWKPTSLGYVYNDGEIMTYDQVVSKSFICGISSFYGGVTSVMKNGYSWSKSIADENQAFYPEIGYSFMKLNESGGTDFTETKYNENTYINTPISYISTTNNSLTGYVSCMVYLNKNDVLQVMEAHRGYTTTGSTNIYYTTSTNVDLSITAASPRSYFELKTAKYAYNTPTEFDVNLNLANFLNKEKKISEWVQNIMDAFNLEFIQDGKTVTIDKKRKLNSGLNYAVELDNRVNSDEAESQMIDYPKSMAIKYKIDVEEWGFEKTVYPPDKLNSPDWANYGDSGYTVIDLNDDYYVTSTSDKNLPFSYTYYDNFVWTAVNSDFIEDPTTKVTLRMPVISKYTYMIDGYNYEESMKHDGYSLSQRFFMKPQKCDGYAWTRTYPAENVDMYLPINMFDGTNLSYKTSEKSLLDRYFNIVAYLASNYVIVEAYITPEEYMLIKNGALLHYDSDLYYPVEITGFDPSGNNKTTIKMMKKI